MVDQVQCLVHHKKAQYTTYLEGTILSVSPRFTLFVATFSLVVFCPLVTYFVLIWFDRCKLSPFWSTFNNAHFQIPMTQSYCYGVRPFISAKADSHEYLSFQAAIFGHCLMQILKFQCLSVIIKMTLKGQMQLEFTRQSVHMLLTPKGPKFGLFLFYDKPFPR
jgi:hypothetical protein